MITRFPSRDVTFPRRALLMGIVNINDDSFSGDGTLDPSDALKLAKKQVEAGADIIDLGAESARTNREAISPAEEISRLESVLSGWTELIRSATPRDQTQIFPPLLSINTWRPEVVEEILDYDVDLINDMSALPDGRNARACAAKEVPLLIMHSVGQPKIPHTDQQWPDLMKSICDFFAKKIELAEANGLSRELLILDPGIDFAKQKADNILLLKELNQLKQFGCPILLPISRKTVIGEVLEIENPAKRDAGTIALLAHGMNQGIEVFRVHNVEACWQSIRVLDPLTRF
ncbi:MAG: dihydropteroate synthase [Akkermansiaceae bacterium]